MLYNNYIPRISIISGIVNKGDAISETILADIEAIDALSAETRRNFDVKIFCRESDLNDTRVCITNTLDEVINDDHFKTSDIYYFHFGIFNDIHHAMHSARRNAKMAIYFHNVTQPQFCAPSAEWLIHQSYQQIGNFLTADKIFAASDFSARQLAGYGMDLDIEVVPLFGPNQPSISPHLKAIPDGDDPIKLLYCGRFASSKGVDQLLEALINVDGRIAHPIHLTLAGKRQFSEKGYIENLKLLAANLPKNVKVSFAFDLDRADIRQLYLTSDAFVLPSMHEGFGMPVVEALLSGTPVICSDAGALREVGGGFSLTHAAGNVDQLTEALVGFCDAILSQEVLCDLGRLPIDAWQESVEIHAATYERHAYIARMKVQFAQLLEPTASWRESTRANLAQVPSMASGGSKPNAWDCAVMATLYASRFGSAQHKRSEAMRALLRLPFDHDQSVEDVNYWLAEWAELGTENLVSHLTNTSEVRLSPARLQSSAFFKDAVRLHVEDQSPLSDEEPSQESGAIGVELLLLMQDRQLSPSEYIRTAYRLALKRDADEEGMGHYLDKLRSTGPDRAWLVPELLDSDEAKLLWGTARPDVAAV
ncbi:glycosyltransferase [Sphingomonas bisphenolicum]|uniref:Glycosyl transferase group 1 n=1 Tax=Sphingomonas bisphenolicum TaxID=296544 RepID=A0ABN5WG19_9SPHN|nr:glycosyltransferase [Sphingomonas bisphenolicum]BBF69215.1 hypothetical protein SBA_ch1_14150 [Sphingomonas bisphenolicum]